MQYLDRQLLQTIPVLIGATSIIYTLVFLISDDPIAALGGGRGLPPAAETTLKAEYNLDKPFIIRHLLYLKGIVVFDFGLTFSGREVTEVMAFAFLVTIELAFMALTFEAIFGTTFGTIAGLRRGDVFDATVLIISLFVVTALTFMTGFTMQLIIEVKLGWLSTIVAGRDNFVSLLIPAIVLGAISFTYVLRLTRQSVSETTSADFVRTTKAEGLKGGRVIRVHILCNSLIPMAAFLGAGLGGLIDGAIITEGIFAIDGVGGNIYQAIIRGGPATVVSFTTVLVLVCIVINLLVDLLYTALDPRICYE